MTSKTDDYPSYICRKRSPGLQIHLISTEVYIVCFDKYYSGGKEDEHWKVMCYLSR